MTTTSVPFYCQITSNLYFFFGVQTISQIQKWLWMIAYRLRAIGDSSLWNWTGFWGSQPTNLSPSLALFLCCKWKIEVFSVNVFSRCLHFGRWSPLLGLFTWICHNTLLINSTLNMICFCLILPGIVVGCKTCCFQLVVCRDRCI